MEELLALIESGASQDEIHARMRELYESETINPDQVREVSGMMQQPAANQPDLEAVSQEPTSFLDRIPDNPLGRKARSGLLRLWGGAQGVGFNLLDDAAKLVGLGDQARSLQDTYEDEIPLWQRMTGEVMGDAALLAATGGASAIPKIGAKLFGKFAGKKAGENVGRAAVRELTSPDRLAVGEAAETMTRRNLLAGSGKAAARESGNAAANWMRLAGEARAIPGGPGAKAFEELVGTKGLLHPGSLGAADAARRHASGSFPISRGLMNLGRKGWNVARHGRVRPGSYEDLSPSAHTLKDLFSKGRQARFLEEGAVFGGLEGLGQADVSEAENLGDAWTRANRGVLGGSLLGAGGGLALGNVANLAQYIGPRFKHFGRPESAEEMMRDMLTKQTGVKPGLPTRAREENFLQESAPLLDEALETPFSTAAPEVAETLGDLRRRGASSIPREITSGVGREATQPVRAGGLMAVADDVAGRNRDNLSELRGGFDEYITQLGDRAVRRGDESMMGDVHDLAFLRLGDRPRRPLAGGLEEDNVLTGKFGLETPGADHALMPDLPATRKIQDILGHTEGDAGLLSQAVQRHMPESVSVRGRPADRGATYGEASELIDQWGQKRTTGSFARGLMEAGSKEKEFASMMDIRSRRGVSERRIEATKRAEIDSGSLDRPDAWDSAMTDFAGDAASQDAYGRHYFESLVDKLNRDPATARRTFRQLLGRSEGARNGIVRMVKESPALNDLSLVEKQSLINEISLLANTEATLAQGANNVMDFLIRRAAGVSTRWSAVGSVSSDLGGNAGKSMSGRKR